jgi:small subunit ribosomal protein S15
VVTDKKNEIIAKYRLHDTDRGSAPVQVALLTWRIAELTDHFRRTRRITTVDAAC